MKKCYCCGAKVPDEARFCPKCGKPIEVTKGLVDRAIEGDAEAQAELYYRTYEVVYHRIREMIGDKETAEELTQDTYLRAFKHLSQLKEPAAFPSWVLTIARNLTINWYRKHEKEKETAAFSGTEDFGEGTLSPDDDVKNTPECRIDFIPDESLDRAETVRLIQEILGSLSDNQRTVLILRFQYQMSINEIAAELELNPNTVKSRLYDGQKRVELKVKEMEKQGTKLYSLAPLPFLLFLLRNAESEAPEISAGQILERVQRSLRASAATDTPHAEQERPVQPDAQQPSPKQTAGHPNTGGITGAATKTAAKAVGGVISKGMAVKAIAVIVAAGLICGSGTAAYTQTRRNTDDAEQEAVSSAPVEAEPTDEQALADADIEGLLESFASWYAWVPYESENLDFSASMAVTIAAEAFAQSSDDYYERMNFDGYQLDTDGIEEYLYDLFGTQYTIEDFEESPTYLIEQRSDGQFYYLGYNDGYMGASVRVVSISDTANEDGTYTVRARYVRNSSYDEYDIFYVDYQIVPDDSAKYGCIITGMSAVEPEGTTDDNDIKDWAELYADYFEAGNSDVSGDGTLSLIYLNDDDIPELLYLEGTSLDGDNEDYIFYIQDGQVKSQRTGDVTVYAERGGYITGCAGRTGPCIEELYYLDENGVLTEVFYGSSYIETVWQYDVEYGVFGNTDYSATLHTEDGSTSAEGEEAYFEARDTVFGWVSDGEHTLIWPTFDGLWCDETITYPGPKMSSAIEYLRMYSQDNWRQLYLDYLDDYDADNDTYALIYLDNDENPLFVCYDTREDYAVLLSMQDGQVTSQTVSYDPDDEEWLWLDDALEYTTAYIAMDEWLEIG